MVEQDFDRDVYDYIASFRGISPITYAYFYAMWAILFCFVFQSYSLSVPNLLLVLFVFLTFEIACMVVEIYRVFCREPRVYDFVLTVVSGFLYPCVFYRLVISLVGRDYDAVTFFMCILVVVMSFYGLRLLCACVVLIGNLYLVLSRLTVSDFVVFINLFIGSVVAVLYKWLKFMIYMNIIDWFLITVVIFYVSPVSAACVDYYVYFDDSMLPVVISIMLLYNEFTCGSVKYLKPRVPCLGVRSNIVGGGMTLYDVRSWFLGVQIEGVDDVGVDCQDVGRDDLIFAIERILLHENRNQRHDLVFTIGYQCGRFTFYRHRPDVVDYSAGLVVRRNFAMHVIRAKRYALRRDVFYVGVITYDEFVRFMREFYSIRCECPGIDTIDAEDSRVGPIRTELDFTTDVVRVLKM